MEFRREARKAQTELWATSLAQDWQAASIDFAQCWLAFVKELRDLEVPAAELAIIHLEFFSDAGRVAMYHRPLHVEGRYSYRAYLACTLPWMEDKWYDLAEEDESDDWEQNVRSFTPFIDRIPILRKVLQLLLTWRKILAMRGGYLRHFTKCFAHSIDMPNGMDF